MASLSTKALTAEIEALLSEKNAGYTECQEKKRRANELLTIKTIKRNIDLALHAAPLPRVSFWLRSAPFFCAVWEVLLVVVIRLLSWFL